MDAGIISKFISGPSVLLLLAILNIHYYFIERLFLLNIIYELFIIVFTF